MNGISARNEALYFRFDIKWHGVALALKFSRILEKLENIFSGPILDKFGASRENIHGKFREPRVTLVFLRLRRQMTRIIISEWFREGRNLSSCFSSWRNLLENSIDNSAPCLEKSWNASGRIWASASFTVTILREMHREFFQGNGAQNPSEFLQ